jgi:hypothetical protein
MAQVEAKRTVKNEAQAIAESVSKALKSTVRESGSGGMFRITDGQRATLRRSLRRAR